MKRILLALTLLVIVFTASRQLEARIDVSVDFFYDNLSAGGNWVEVGDYGYCWQPTIAVSNRSWRPYADGYWAYTDVGWTWVSYEDFGWATYHYGRWTRLRDRGWIWVPGREWAPAWVSWRTGGDYVGWAPLPPRGSGEVVYDSRPITAQVDIDFDIGPLYYNFVDVRYIGEPVLRERIFASDQNVSYISRTVNVTNITYSNNQVYNYGPDYNTLSRYSTRPIQRLTLQRDANADLSVAVRSNSLMTVQGDKLMVAAPQVFVKPPAPVAPKVLKEKILKPTFERGWTGDEKAQAEMKQKIKAEDPKTVPPPTVKPRERADLTASPATSPAATSPATAMSPVTSATAAPSVSPAFSPAKDKGKNKQKENASPAPSVSVATTPAVSPDTKPEKAKDKKKDNAAPMTTPATSVAPSSPAPAVEKTEKPAKIEKPKRNEKPVATAPPLTAPATVPSVAPDMKPNKKDVVRPSGPEPMKPDTAPAVEKTEKPAKTEKPKRNEKPVAPAPPLTAPATVPSVAPEMKPNKKDVVRPSGPEPATPDTVPAVQDKSRKIQPAPPEPNPQTAVEPPAKPEKKSKQQPFTQERSAPPPAPAVNAPAPELKAKDNGKKNKKDEPVPAPTP